MSEKKVIDLTNNKEKSRMILNICRKAILQIIEEEEKKEKNSESK